MCLSSLRFRLQILLIVLRNPQKSPQVFLFTVKSSSEARRYWWVSVTFPLEDELTNLEFRVFHSRINTWRSNFPFCLFQLQRCFVRHLLRLHLHSTQKLINWVKQNRIRRDYALCVLRCLFLITSLKLNTHHGLSLDLVTLD